MKVLQRQTKMMITRLAAQFRLIDAIPAACVVLSNNKVSKLFD